ncbi:MAG: alpha/beta hydrolase [Armatimonadaceae bacterium]
MDWERVDGRVVRLLLSPPYDPLPDSTQPLNLPILFLHGLGCSARVWEPTMRELRHRNICCPSVAPDLPGYGHSPGPSKALSMPDLADWCLRFMDARGMERVHLVGNSMGCQVALTLALRCPQRVGAVVVQGPTTGNSRVPLWRYSLGLLADVAQETLPYNLLLLGTYLQMGIPRYFATVRRMMQQHVFAMAPHVLPPVLVIRGGHDAIVQASVAKELARLLPHGEYIALDAAAHAIEYTHPREFTSAMLSFLIRSERALRWQSP